MTETVALPKAFDHRLVEEELYDRWLQSGAFTATIDWSQKPFAIVIPPPNVTGELHYGHAMFVAFQDLMIRWHRMTGRPTLWLPGTDHAGIATQIVVENELAKEGLSRFDLGREKFVARVWDWKQKYGNIINLQLRRLGASVDWTRERFTLDEQLSRAVRVAFVRLFEKGLIYRGNYLVNWCPRCMTVLSDLEVDHEETAGNLWYIRYPLIPADDRAAEQEYLVVATTRPETMLGDTVVAVNPSDECYVGLIGRQVMPPFVDRVIPIIADAAVDPSFGTGAVKVTPAHDQNDYEIGKRHGLAAINVMNLDATINENGGPFQGMDRYAARAAIVAQLQAQGLLERVEDHVSSVGHCQRCDTVVEPMISEQWFVKIKPLAEPAIEAVRDGRITFVPERFARVYFNWMDNIRDWPISRQLWWGHRIPVWYCDACGEVIASVEDPTACPKCGASSLRQDPDVLDTWFSSGLWPFSTLGWPEQTDDLRYFYPTNTLATARDIIFLWVARMIMFGLEFRGEVPFSDVYINPTVLNIEGRRMSKSLGTGLDPLDLIERYGADSLRFALINRCTGEQDLRFSEKMVEDTRNFANKIWNAARLVRLHLERHDVPAGRPRDVRTLPNRWILGRFARAAADVTAALETFEFSAGCRRLYEFIWNEFCDWYLEMAKVDLQMAGNGQSKPLEAAAGETRHVMSWVLANTMALLHPVMPAITEEIWQALPHDGETVMRTPWPDAPGEWSDDAAAEGAMGEVMEITTAIRGLRAEMGLGTQPVSVSLHYGSGDRERIERVRPYVGHLAHLEAGRLQLGGLDEHPPFGIPSPCGAGRIEIHVDSDELRGRVRERFQKQLGSIEQELAGVTKRLQDPVFRQKAPAETVEATGARASELSARRNTLRRYVADLGGRGPA